MKTNDELELEVNKLKQELKETNNKLDNIIGILKNPNIKVIKLDSKITDKEIFEMRQATSINKTAAKLGISKSTVQRACWRYQEELMSNMGD